MREFWMVVLFLAFFLGFPWCLEAYEQEKRDEAILDRLREWEQMKP